MDVRWFSGEVEDGAPPWRAQLATAEPWVQTGLPGEAGGEAQGFFVKLGAIEGYAKDSGAANRAAHEKIAADLAHELGLPVPPVVLWDAGGVTRAISRVPFPNAHKWDIAQQAPNAVAKMLPDLSRAASAMVAFDTWVDNRDRINGGNLIVTLALPRGFGCAFIDYSYSLTHGWGVNPMGPATTPVGPFPPSVTIDRAILADAVSRIEAMPDETVEAVVRRVPDAFINSQLRDAIVAGLAVRRASLRTALGL